MTRDDIIRMAYKAGLETCRGDGWPDERLLPKLKHFAALVAAAEREACLSKIKEAKADIWGGLDEVIKETAVNVCDNLIIRIRAREQA